MIVVSSVLNILDSIVNSEDEDKFIWFVINIENIDDYYFTFSLYSKCSNVPLRWIGKDLSYEKKIIDVLKKIIGEISSRKTSIDNNYINSIFYVNPEEFLAEYHKLCEDIRLLIGKGYSDEMLYKQHLSVLSEMNELLLAVQKIQMVSQLMNDAYGIESKDSSIEFTAKLLDVSETLIKIENLSSEIAQTENIILQNFNSDIFNVDFESILNRFTTVYVTFISDITEHYNTKVFTVDDKTVFQNYENVCKVIRTLISDNFTENYFFYNYSEIDSVLRSVLEIFNELNNYFVKMSNAYLPGDAYDSIARLHVMLDVCDVLFEKAILNEEIESIERIILSEFKRNIFDIDSEGLFGRFNLEYQTLVSKIKDRYTEEVFSIDNELFYIPFENASQKFRSLTGGFYSDDYIFENYSVIDEDLRNALDIFCELKISYGKLQDAYSSDNDGSSIEKLKILLNVCRILLTKREFQNKISDIESILLENCEESIFGIDVDEIQNRFNGVYVTLIQKISSGYKSDVYSLDNKKLWLPYENACEQIKNILNAEYTEDEIFEEYVNINANLENALRVFTQLNALFVKMNAAYVSDDGNGNIEKINKLLEVCEALIEKEKFQHEIDCIDSVLLNECEKSIFDIDAEEMLNRFKVDYTGFFRIFKKQYREDIKQLRLGYKDIKKKITNDEAGSLLQKLKERNQLINAKNDELQKVSVILGVSAFSDIDSVLTRQEINTVKVLISSAEEILIRYPKIRANDIHCVIRSLYDAQTAVNNASSAAKYIESLSNFKRKYSEIKSDLTELFESHYIEDMADLQKRVNLDNKLSFDEAGLLLRTLEKRKCFIDLKNNELKKAADILGMSDISDIDSVMSQQEIDTVIKMISEAEEILDRYQINDTDIDCIITALSDVKASLISATSEAKIMESWLIEFRSYSEIKNDLLQLFNSEYIENMSCLQSIRNNSAEKLSYDDALAIIRKLNNRNELISEKKRKLKIVANMLGMTDFEDIDSALTRQEMDNVKQLIDFADEQLREFSEINLESGIGDIIRLLSYAIEVITGAVPEIEYLKSMLINKVNYSKIKSDICQLLDSHCISDMSEISSMQSDSEHELTYNQALSLLENLYQRQELITERYTETGKTEIIPGVLLSGNESVLSDSEISESREIINHISSVLKKYPDIVSDSIENMIQILLKAQSVLKNIDEETEKIKSYLKTERTYKDIILDFQVLQEYNSLNREYDNHLKSAKEMFDFTTIERDTDWNALNILVTDFEELISFAEKSNISPEWIKLIFDKEKGEKAEGLQNIFLKITNVKSYINEFIRLFSEEYRDGLGDFVKLKTKLEKCIDQFESMDSWIDYRDCRLICVENGLTDFVEQSEDIAYPAGMLNKVFLKAFYYSWIEDKIDKMKMLGKFNARVHNDNIEKFRALDKHQLPLAQMRIREKLISEMPDKSMVGRNGDEMSVLLHELGKKRKIMPLRKLFRSIPNLLLRLKPCLMMSPLSVSYFLEASTYKFDMVIFDEASQIFPQDAIGAIFRGSQVIIAGDSKQLPPTNFFSVNAGIDFVYDSDDEDDEEIISDSILEEASNTIPNRFLLWHYRSRYEDLITFSNKEIYGGNLVTFPSSRVNEADSGVEYIYVRNGVYENRCNKEEAYVCVSLIEQHIKKHPERSLGIIAFSESQQNTIEDAVQEFRKKHREYDDFFSEEKESAFFVKNLENVQGDERDTIIFSICYGKNSQGRMYMRFGPLGHVGGERRLNVAITRAKYNVKLVGSILPEDIDLSKTKSDGVKMLRKYIEFASSADKESGISYRKNKLYENDLFSENVAEFLENKGYKVKRNVGASGYTVDIAVEHPNISGAYVTGIECDGDAYQMARTVRDRDHLRTAVMEKMGWRMYHIWSTEWIQNEQNAKKKLVDYISYSIDNYSVFEKTEAFAEEIKIETEEVAPKINDSKSGNSNNPYDIEKYQEGHWWEVKKYRAYDNESKIADRIHEIIRVEQPIHLDLLYKRMAGCFGNEKVTAPIRDTVNYVMKTKMSREIKTDKEKFITLSDFSSVKVRRSLPGNPDRNIEYISLKEIEEAMKLVLSGAFGLEIPVLILDTARIFGFEKTGVKIKQRMTEAIESLNKQGVIRVADERVQLLEE